MPVPLQRRPCPYCGEPCQIHLDTGVDFCEVCHFEWLVVAADTSEMEVAAFAYFSTDEFRRLEIYRKAVAVRFFHDGL